MPGRYSVLDCLQGVVDVWQIGRVEAATYPVVRAGIGDDRPGRVGS